MSSKIEVNQIAAATGSTITLVSGQTLDLSSGTVTLPSTALSALNASNLTSGTVSTSVLPTIPTTKGGTGLTTIGTANQVLKVNSGATALEFGTLSSELTPAFRATGGSSYPTGISAYTWTLQQVDTVDFISSGGTFNNTAGNYKWTPSTAGKYLFNIVIGAYYSTGGRNQTSPWNYGIAIGKNGSAGTAYQYANSFAQNCNCYSGGANLTTIQTANGTSDYFQIYVWSDLSGVSFSTAEFSAFRLIGI
jgi:hypothetical protein